MGKPTGFLDYPRRSNPAQAPLERIQHWNEFHPVSYTHLDVYKRQILY